MGFFINTVTQEELEREIDVVINEKRQGVDNRPYGFTNDVSTGHYTRRDICTAGP
jgi:zinc protease